MRPPAWTPSPSGSRARALDVCHRPQHVRALAARRTHPEHPVLPGAGRHSHQVQLAVSGAWEVDVGDGGEARSIEHGATRHGAERRPDEQLVRDEGRHRVPGESETGVPVASSTPKAKGLAGLTAICIERVVAPPSFWSTVFIDVAVTDTDASARHQGVAPDRCLFEESGEGLLVVSGHAEVDGTEAVRPEPGSAAPGGWRRGSSRAPGTRWRSRARPRWRVRPRWGGDGRADCRRRGSRAPPCGPDPGQSRARRPRPPSQCHRRRSARAYPHSLTPERRRSIRFPRRG